MSNLAHSDQDPRAELSATVKRSVVVEAEPAEVWEALTDPALLGEWLADEVEFDPREGGELVCRFGDGEERRGEVALVEEAERLAFTWWRDRGPGHEPEESRVDLFVDAVADGTRVTVIETAGRPDVLSPIGGLFGPSLAAGAWWAARLGGLRLAARLVLA